MNWIAGTSVQAGRLLEPRMTVPPEVVCESAGGGAPDALRDAVGGDEVDGGAIAVCPMSGFAGGGGAQGVAAQDPHDVGVEARVDELGRAARGHRPRGQRAKRARGYDALGDAQLGGADRRVAAAPRARGPPGASLGAPP